MTHPASTPLLADTHLLIDGARQLRYCGIGDSRLDDARKGSDIDLLIESAPVADSMARARIKNQLEHKLQLPLDVLATWLTGNWHPPANHPTKLSHVVEAPIMMTPDVTHVQTLQNCELLVSFADGNQRRFSMLPYLHFPAYQDLNQPGKFALAHVSNGRVAWSDDIDMSPDTLYLAGQEVTNLPTT